MNARYIFAAILVALAIYSATQGTKPTPAPLPSDHLSLAGCFTGPDGAEDAATVSCLASELADAIEHDGMDDEPFLDTGVAFDELRTRARDFRCRGESLGSKYPQLRDKVQRFLEQRVGVSGGPVTSRQRAEWVSAYREIARAAEHAIK